LGEEDEPAPEDVDTEYDSIASGLDEAESLTLTRGQYRLEMTVPLKEGESLDTVEGRAIRLNDTDELKRVYIYKSDLVDTGRRGDDGRRLGKMTVVFRVVDNPVWAVPLAYAIAGTAAGVGGYFFLDDLKEATGDFAFDAVTVAASVATVALAIRTLF
jgi:hypothetical protein